MNKNEFLKELLNRLSALPQAEQDKAYAFYAEMIDDRMEDGMDEEEAVSKLGSMEEIVERIVAEIPMKVLLQARVGKKHRSGWMLFLIVLGSPVWAPLLIAAAAVLFVLFVCLWVINLVLWVVLGSAAAAVIGGAIGIFIVPGFGAKLMYTGILLAGTGCAMLLYPASIWMTRQFAAVTKRLWQKMKSRILKK